MERTFGRCYGKHYDGANKSDQTLYVSFCDGGMVYTEKDSGCKAYSYGDPLGDEKVYFKDPDSYSIPEYRQALLDFFNGKFDDRFIQDWQKWK